MKKIILLSMFFVSCGSSPEHIVVAQADVAPAMPPEAIKQAAEECLPAAQLNVIQGELDEVTHPSTVKIYPSRNGVSGVCTAGVIGSNKLITAGHCLEGADSVFIQMDGFKIMATKFRIHPNFQYNQDKLEFSYPTSDIGVIELPSQFNLAIPEAPLGSDHIKAGECFSWVGYGRNIATSDANTDGKRRIGANVVSRLMTINSTPVPSSRTKRTDMTSNAAASFGRGDSGAPVYNKDGEIVGLVSMTITYGDHESFESVIADTTNEQTRAFINGN